MNEFLSQLINNNFVDMNQHLYFEAWFLGHKQLVL